MTCLLFLKKIEREIERASIHHHTYIIMESINKSDEYEELVLDLYSLTRDCGITINTINDVCIDQKKMKNLNAIVWLKTSIKNDVLFNDSALQLCLHEMNNKIFGNYDLKLIMLKYNVYLKWYDKYNAYLCYTNTYFLSRPDHRVLCNDYNTIILCLKKIVKHKPLKVWSLNDNDYFTSIKKSIFKEYPASLSIVSIENDEYDEDELEEYFDRFTALYDLEMININNNLLLFYKI